jgi:hypothetical protein
MTVMPSTLSSAFSSAFASAFSSALSSAFSSTLNGIVAGGCVPTKPVEATNPSHASTSMQGGAAVFENDNYRITAGDNNEVMIHNKNTGETYKAWGDPHMEIDGKQAFDFWGTTSFVLDDGTKVTIETTPWKNNPEMTLSSKVTITNGDYGVQITGVDTNTTGDLKIDEGKGWGNAVDWAVPDGNVLYENTFGSGFVGIDGHGNVRSVDQNFINETDLKKGGALQAQYQDAFRALSGLLSITFFGAFVGSLFGGSTPAQQNRRDDVDLHQIRDWLGPDLNQAKLEAMPPTQFALTLARWEGHA